MLVDNLQSLLDGLPKLNYRVDMYSGCYVIRSELIYCTISDDSCCFQYYKQCSEKLTLSINFRKDDKSVHIANVTDGLLSTDVVGDILSLTTESSFFQQSTLRHVPYDIETYALLITVLTKIILLFGNTIDASEWI